MSDNSFVGLQAERARRKKEAEKAGNQDAEMEAYLAKMKKMEAVDAIDTQLEQLRERARTIKARGKANKAEGLPDDFEKEEFARLAAKAKSLEEEKAALQKESSEEEEDAMPQFERREVGCSVKEKRGSKGKGKGAPRGPANSINVRSIHVGKIIGQGGATIKVIDKSVEIALSQSFTFVCVAGHYCEVWGANKHFPRL